MAVCVRAAILLSAGSCKMKTLSPGRLTLLTLMGAQRFRVRAGEGLALQNLQEHCREGSMSHGGYCGSEAHAGTWLPESLCKAGRQTRL
jgi:hypothetical protein